jgi:pimeloyl-ACP methyl ester carboxylesterase
MGLRWLALLVCMLSPTAALAQECVILLPGVAMAPLSMLMLQLRLEADGYHAWNRGYAPTTQPIEKSALVIGRALDDCEAAGALPAHIVTHSMGGLLVRVYFQDRRNPRVGRVVMLGPPNHGSDMAERFHDRWWYRFTFGEAGQQITKSAAPTVLNLLKPLPLEIGVVASTRDTRVSVENARLDEMKDLAVFGCSHTAMPYSRAVYRQVRAFLATGRFEESVHLQSADAAGK